MGLATMAQHRGAPVHFKDEPTTDSQHHPHHQPGPPHPQYPRPSVVHQQHHGQAAHPPPQQHSTAYPSSHVVYQPQSQASNGQHAQHAQELPYYPAHPSPYSTPGASSGYQSAETGEMMAATMPRPQYPPMNYHTPQSNSPASVASPSTHDQSRGIYGQPPSQMHTQYMNYGAPQTSQYTSMPQQAQPSPYGQHAQTSQPNLMMSHSGTAPHPMGHHAPQHAQAGMAGSPRNSKIEANMPSSLARSSAPGPMSQPQPQPNGQALSTPIGSTPGVNPSAAPGPIPATTPLVVRQDGNGVQWIAFEYSRDRVKMEYTIRCDVESVNTDELASEFKQENCVYPRACCAKDQYRGNRLQYETECNTVGWALAQLNPPLRGKRGLIQRAVDSWRNSNQDPRLRSRRVRRQAKMNTRKPGTPQAHLVNAPAGMPGAPASMGPGGATLAKSGIPNSMGSQLHHHHAHPDGRAPGGDEVGDDSYSDGQHHHHHHPPATSEERTSQVFNSGYGAYGSSHPTSASSGSTMPSLHDTLNQPSPTLATLGRRRGSESSPAGDHRDEPEGLFPDLPEPKKRKFILVDDHDRSSRMRVRVTLESVDTREIPDSFRKTSSVYPRSFFPREMQSPPPSATGSRFFMGDLTDIEDDGATETEGRGPPGSHRINNKTGTVMIKVPIGDGQEGDVAVPRMRRLVRAKELRLNDLGYRMAWLQSRVFAGRTVFLQRALDCYRNKLRQAMDQISSNVVTQTPHFETRVGKRKWNERMRSRDKKDD